MNYMKQVAKILGVEIGKEFRVDNDHFLYKLDDKGVYYLANDNKWKKDSFKIGMILSGECKIIEKPILDDTEKEYLSLVIEPFRGQVKGISKNQFAKKEWIYIAIKNDKDLSLPSFESLA